MYKISIDGCAMFKKLVCQWVNALPINIKICRQDTKGLKPAFTEYFRTHFFYCETEFT